VHFLRSRAVARALVDAAALVPDSLVPEFGAGALTEALAATGARVLAIERDEVFVRELQRRFGDRPTVRVVAGDLRTMPLPRRPFTVVANIPFSASTPLLRRLLGGRVPLRAAEQLVARGFASGSPPPCPATPNRHGGRRGTTSRSPRASMPRRSRHHRGSPPHSCRSGGPMA